MRLRLAFVAAVTLGLASIVVQCRSATQMIIEVTTDLPCSQNGGTSITIGELGKFDSKTPATVSTMCTDGGATHTIGSLVVTPSGDDDALIAFQVTAGIGKDPSACEASPASCIVARRSLRFIPHETIRIEVPLREVCAGISCIPDSTCFAGACVSATIDPSKCVGEVCGESSIGSPDGGISDDGSGPIIAEPDSGARDAQPDTSLPRNDGGAFSVLDLVIGNEHGCLLTNGGTVYCWGTNDNGQLGNGSISTTPNPVPMVVPGLGGVVAIAGADNTNAAKLSDGGFYVWGVNALHTFPNDMSYQNPTPVRVDSALSFDHFCVGRGQLCGVAGNQLQCWGSTLGSNSTPITGHSFTTTLDAGSAVDISCGDDTTTILTNTGTVLTFGGSTEDLGRSADGGGSAAEGGATPLPVSIPDGGVIARFSAGEQDTFAFVSDNVVYAWGTNLGPTSPQLTGDFGPRTLPVPVEPAFKGFTRVVVGNLFACGLRDQQVFCWGAADDGELALPTSAVRKTTPSKVIFPADAAGAPVRLWGRSAQACAGTSDGNIYCWGNNDKGQLGIGTIDPTIDPNADPASAPHPTPTKMLLPSSN